MKLKKLIERLQKERINDSAAGLKNSAEGEKYLQQSYEGRFLFELIQNARDANKISGINGKIAIKVTQNSISISNTGKAFDDKGIEGITLIGSSTKSGQGFIGFKGIGFKSILEISDFPKVVTSYGTVLFDREKTADLLLGKKLPLEHTPIFFIPHYLDDSLTPEEKNEGFVTRIELPYKSTVVADTIWHSFNKIGVEQLVLLGYIDSLTYESEDHNSNFTIKKNIAKHTISINHNEESFQYVHFEPSKKISIPDEIIAKLEGKEKEMFSKENFIEISLVFDINKENKLQPISSSKLYLYYPIEITSGFNFIIHSSFIVNPERKALRNNALNNFIMEEIAIFLATEWLSVVKKSFKSSFLDLLVFKRNSEVNTLSILYDTLVKELSTQKFIYDSFTRKFYGINEIIIADGFDKGIFPENTLNDKRLIYIGNEATRDWLLKEFDVDYLSAGNVADNIEKECQKQLKNKNIEYFNKLYAYLSNYKIEVGDRKILLCSDLKLRKPSEDVFYGKKDNKQLPKSINRKIFFVHPNIDISNFRDTNIGFIEYNTDLLISRLLKLYEDKTVEELDLLITLLNIDVPERLLSNVKGVIKLPVGNTIQWLNPLFHPIYIKLDELQEIYPAEKFINYEVFQGIGISDEELNDKLIRLGAFDFPAVYYKNHTIAISRNKDPNRFNFLLGLKWFSTDFFVVEGDWIIDVPDKISNWFTKTVINSWEKYKKRIENTTKTRVKYSTQRSDHRFTTNENTFSISSFLKYLREEKWIFIVNKEEVLSISDCVGLDPIEFKQHTFSNVEKYLNIFPISFEYQKDQIKNLQLKHLDSDNVLDIKDILAKIASESSSYIGNTDFVSFYNKILSKLYDCYLNNRGFDLDEIKALSNTKFLGIDNLNKEFVFKEAKNIYYIEDKPSFDILPAHIQKDLQPHFTNRDKNKFGQIGKKIGKDFKDAIQTKTITYGEIKNTTIFEYIPSFPEIIAFVECLLETDLDKELKKIKEVNLIICKRIELEIFIDSIKKEGINNVDFKIDLDNKSILVSKDQFNDLAINTKTNLIYEYFTSLLSRDLSRLKIQLEDLLCCNTNSFKKFLAKYDVPIERIDEIKEGLYDRIFSDEEMFWHHFLHIIKVDITFEDNNAIIELAKRHLIQNNFEYDKLINFNFSHWNAEGNRIFLQELFDCFGVELQTFNASALYKIDFSGYYNTKMIALKELEKDNYYNKLYNQLLTYDIESQSNFQSLIDSFMFNNSFKINSPVLKLDYKEHFSKFLKQNFSIGDVSKNINWKINYEPNKQVIYEELIGENYIISQIDDFFIDIKNTSLLYFQNTKEYLINKFKKEFSLPTSANAVYSSTLDFLDVFYNPKDITIETVNTKQSWGNNNSTQLKKDKILGKPRVDGSDNQNISKTGLIAEKVVYEALSKMNHKKVEWVSKNAAKAGVNPEGSDSIGYDILFIDLNDNINYVEVKGTSGNDNQFYISYSEYMFALSNPNNYNIIRVYNVLDNNKRRIVSLGNLFILEDGEELFSNSRFNSRFKTLEINYEIYTTDQ
ncbi:DUF3883 domain-containing protein [Myroides odoratimimus]|uniref:DUF3883 domain-containing protein n=1 Tax=Myroides odoratimimus TaxID=76832 RepID=UPI0025757689|nr:DUF3883 domain-containing protein [Myroides odoratimimus]MDM1461753.1 DUF3883 domain-containing protein [Myroides odoratimimus]